MSVIKVEKIYTKNAQSAIIRKKHWKTMLYNLSEETEDYFKAHFLAPNAQESRPGN